MSSIGTEAISAMSALNTYPETGRYIEFDKYLSEVEPMAEHSYEHLKAVLVVADEVKMLLGKLQRELRKEAMESEWEFNKFEKFENLFTAIQQKI